MQERGGVDLEMVMENKHGQMGLVMWAIGNRIERMEKENSSM